MKQGLDPKMQQMVNAVLTRFPAVERAVVFGSRAKGTAAAESDVDIAVFGRLTNLEAETIAGELDELPQPLQFDVVAYERIKLRELREHIDRVGMEIFRRHPETDHASSPNTARA